MEDEFIQAYGNLRVTATGQVHHFKDDWTTITTIPDPTNQLIIGDIVSYNSDTLPTVILRNGELVSTTLPSGTIKYMGENTLVMADNSVWVFEWRDWVRQEDIPAMEIDQAHHDTCDGLLLLGNGTVYEEPHYQPIATGIVILANNHTYIDQEGNIWSRSPLEEFEIVGRIGLFRIVNLNLQ
jgi:hypothetical protein